jgi:hypothetical protein
VDRARQISTRFHGERRFSMAHKIVFLGLRRSDGTVFRQVVGMANPSMHNAEAVEPFYCLRMHTYSPKALNPTPLEEL